MTPRGLQAGQRLRVTWKLFITTPLLVTSRVELAMGGSLKYCQLYTCFIKNKIKLSDKTITHNLKHYTVKPKVYKS